MHVTMQRFNETNLQANGKGKGNESATSIRARSAALQNCSVYELHDCWSRNAEQAECLCKVDACSIHQRQTSLGKLRLFAEHTAIGVERMEETSKILSIVRKPERRTITRSACHQIGKAIDSLHERKLRFMGEQLELCII